MLSDSISDRTLALLLSDVFIVSKPQISLVQLIWTNKANVPADLQSAGIKYKDFNPLTSYFYFRYEFLIKKIAIKVWISDHRSWYLMLSDSISDRTIALLILDIFVVSFGYNQLTLHFDSYCCFLTFYRYKTNAPLVQSIWTNKANVPADL